ncbi:GNAT family N-acetyltransferase [Natrialba sp. SSL1]|uniref:GNAT family N-acetyltransferase n=1 Tax=Natrialba sp. SSL1 TaxID=1869245 RepID=UPI0008F926E3|nr:GNAT family N-acetyltransferase [Natrialba sp. SSL1]OIB57940.1 acetyltransferase [Natrialba sp. SSL1]
MVDYRPLRDGEAFHEFRQYAFGPSTGIEPYDPDEHETPRDRRGGRRAIYEHESDDDANPRSVCRHYWLETHVRGDTHPTAGLASVATPPEFRRQGYVRDLLAHSLEEYRERNYHFSVLWPFSYGFYNTYGWDTSNRLARHAFDPDLLSFASAALDASAATYSYQPLESDAFARLQSVYETHTERYALAIDRGEWWWRHRIFEGHDVDPYVYAAERDGDTVGYLVYGFDSHGDSELGERTMVVSELVGEDHEAFLALLAFCHRHASQVEEVVLELPPEAPFREAVHAPDEVETTVENGPMVRVVDVAETLSTLSYPQGVETTRSLSVTDPLADWNSGTFELSVRDGSAACERVQDAGDERDSTADARLGIAALSQLVVGARSSSALARTNRLEAADEVVSELNRLFPETGVYFGDHF